MGRQLDKALLGEEMENLEVIAGNNSLKAEIDMFGEDLQFKSLSADFTGIYPDNGFSTIPYEKIYQLFSNIRRKGRRR